MDSWIQMIFFSLLSREKAAKTCWIYGNRGNAGTWAGLAASIVFVAEADGLNFFFFPPGNENHLEALRFGLGGLPE